MSVVRCNPVYEVGRAEGKEISQARTKPEHKKEIGDRPNETAKMVLWLLPYLSQGIARP